MNNQLLKTTATLVACIGLFACSTTPKQDNSASSAPAATPAPAAPRAAPSTPATPAETRSTRAAPAVNTTAPAVNTTAPAVNTTSLSLDSIAQSGNILCQRSTYFDFDKQTVKNQYLSAIQAHGQLLGKERSAKVLIQGNTDDRGSREYNLALGQRRADAVKEILTAAGASSGQVQTSSLGKEKPKASGQDEEAWSINRRADILYGNESRVPSCSNMNP